MTALRLLCLALITGVVLPGCSWKENRARRAIESMAEACSHAEEHGGTDVAVRRQYAAKEAVDALGYSEQDVFRQRANEAWRPCADWQVEALVKKELGVKSLATPPRHMTHDQRLKWQAAFDYIERQKSQRSWLQGYPYPADRP